MIQAKHKTVIVFGVLGLVILAWQCPVSAAVVWDETTNGDLSNFIASPTHLPFSSELENSIVNASVGGSSDPNIGDGYDVLEFVVAIEGRLKELRFDSYNGISDSNFDIYLFGSLLYSTTVSSTDVDRNYVEDIKDANPSTILSGFFTIQIANFISIPHPYSMSYLATVPEPSTLLLACLAGCALLRRR